VHAAALATKHAEVIGLLFTRYPPIIPRAEAYWLAQARAAGCAAPALDALRAAFHADA
jgi:hypothetical protein